MPRKGPVTKRKIPVDPKYGDLTVAKFINSLIYDGKKSKAEKIFYDAMDVIAEKTGKDPLEVFLAAMDNVKPGIEVRPRRVGGATYQVPMDGCKLFPPPVSCHKVDAFFDKKERREVNGREAFG